MSIQGKKIDELEQVTNLTNETVLPVVVVNNNIPETTAKKVTISQIVGAVPTGITTLNGNASFVSQNLTDGTEQSGTATYTYKAVDQELQLFRTVYSGNKVYSLKIKKGGVLVADYIPVIDSNNVAGFWDKATKSFKTAQDTSIYTGVIEE